MKKLKLSLLWVSLSAFILTVSGQTEPPKLYNPLANAKSEIADAVKVAKAENKHVFIQVGGNW
ncbi:MAG: hypothetical protein K9H49_01220 [Bacteroidales bacterium]|nr:hypothetical protein [Bacteroidales bacterium]MCF8403818.1 hypothetical protein [Bacteroidales bacterium]